MPASRLLSALAPLLSALAVAGCKVGPEFAPPGAPVAATWSLRYPPTIGDAQAVDSQWWHSLNDPVLDELVQRVRIQNFTLEEASARIVEARARLGIARGGLWPEIHQTDAFKHFRFSPNGVAFPIPTNIPGFTLAPFDLWSVGFDVSWEIDITGKLHRAAEAAEADLDAAVENHSDVLVSLLGEVARTYVELRTNQERVAVAQENVHLQRQTVQLTEDRLQAGTASPLEVSQAKTQLFQTEAAVPELINQVKLAENRLCVLQGEPPRSLEADLHGRRPIPSPPAHIAVGLPFELLRRRPDVRKAESEIAAQSARIGVAIADLYPQLSLPGTFALNARNFSDLFDWNSLYYSVGPSLTWNILNFGRVRSNIAAQDARWEQTVASYRQTVLNAGEEVENAISTLVRQREREERLAAAASSALDAVKVAQTRYVEGVATFQSLLDVQRVLVQVQEQHVAAQGQVTIAAIALYKALGGGWEVQPPDIEVPPEALPGDQPTPAGPGTGQAEELTLPLIAPGGGSPANKP